MEDCYFCQRVTGQIPLVGGPIYEDDLVFAAHVCDDDAPTYLGYLMAGTRRHAPTLADLTDAEAQALGLLTTRLSRALTACVSAERTYLVLYGEAVPHVHLFVTARYPNIPPAYWRARIYDWPDAPRGGPEDVAALAARLRAHLAAPA